MKRYKSIFKEGKNLPSNLVKQFQTRAASERRSGTEIEINYRLPYISVGDYFFQGQEAEDLLEEVPDNISAEDYILAIHQNW